MSIIISILFSAYVSAANAESDHCKVLGDIAESIMSQRQEGVAMSSLMSKLTTSELAQSLIVEAYRTPRFRTEENKAAAAEDFRNAIEAMCYE